MEAAPQARDGGTDTGGAASPPISPRADAQLLRAAAAGRAGGKTTTMGAWIKTPKERKCADAQSRNTQAYAASPWPGSPRRWPRWSPARCSPPRLLLPRRSAVPRTGTTQRAAQISRRPSRRLRRWRRRTAWRWRR
ncbi:hypothetical protein ACQ4PT_067429 [Festuca glaucescens]